MVHTKTKIITVFLLAIIPVSLANASIGGNILNLTFKSKIDGSPQPLLIKLPEGYTPQKAWPLLVTLHGLGDGPIVAADVKSMVQIGPYGRGSVWFSGIGEQDVFECIETTKKIYSIDEKRIYLCGFSMGAAATFDIALKYPDRWAACVPVCGRCENTDLIKNAEHIPFWINSGSLDTVIPPEYSWRAYNIAKMLTFNEWKYTEYENMEHSFDINWQQIEGWLLTKEKVLNPKRVSFCTRDLNSNRAYWVEITGIQEYGKNAGIEAVIDGQKINVTTQNISNYTLGLNNNLIDLTRKIQVIENGVNVLDGFLKKGGCFSKIPKKDNAVVKRPGLSGPLWDIYCSRSVLVYGTNSDDKALIKAAKNCAGSFSNPRWMNKVDFRIIADTAVTEKDIAENNLVLFGNTNTNTVLAKIAEKLPVKMKGNHIAAGGADYSGDNVGCVLICPNPLNRQKYVAVFSGNTAEAIDCFDKIWPNLNSVPKNIDVGVFEISGYGNSVNWLFKGIFGSDWNWQSKTGK